MKNLIKIKLSILILLTGYTMLPLARAEDTPKNLPYDTLSECTGYYDSDRNADFACVSQGQKKGYINRAGELLYPLGTYDNFVEIDSDKWFVAKNGLYRAIDASGKEILPPKYKRIKKLSPHFFAGSYEDDGRDVQDVITYQSGKLSIPSKCREFEAMYNDTIGVCLYSYPNDSWYVFVDGKGNQDKAKYEEIKKVAGKDWFIVKNYANERVGIVDFAKQTIVPSEYAEIKFLDNGFIVYKNIRGYWGLMDSKAKILVEPQYDNIGYEILFDQWITFKLDGRIGLLDSTGKEVTPPKYRHIGDYNNDNYDMVYAKDTNDNTALFTTALVPINVPQNVRRDSLQLLGNRLLFSLENADNENSRLTDLTGNLMIPPQYKKLFALDEQGQFFKATTIVNDKLKTGVLDKNGKLIVPFEYLTVKLENNFFIATQVGKERYSTIFTIFNQKGEVLLKPQAFYRIIYDDARQAFLLFDKITRYSGYVDMAGNINKMNFWRYKRGQLLNANHDQALLKGKKFGLVNRNGEMVLPFEYEDLFGFPDFPKQIFYKQDGLYGVMTKTGDKLLPPQFEDIGSRLKNGTGEESEELPLLLVKQNDQWGVYDLYSQRVVIPAEYDNIRGYIFHVGHQPLVEVEKNQRYGLVDLSGKVIVPPEYTNFYSRVFRTGGQAFLEVKKNRRYGLFDLSGKVIMPPEFSEYKTLFNDEMFVGYDENRQWQAVFDASGKKRFIRKVPPAGDGNDSTTD